MPLAVVILAAGQGTRMQSRRQKILHEVGGQPMVEHIFASAFEAADLPPVLVVGQDGDDVRQLFGQRAQYVVQSEQRGTAHATQMAESLLRGQADQVLVTYADMPLLRAESMGALAGKQRQTGAPLAMLTVLGNPKSSFGRVVRDGSGRVVEIVEVAEARQRSDTEELLAIRELNPGLYCFAADWLWENLPNLPMRQARRGQEYYLTDMVGLAVNQGHFVETIAVDDPDECLGAGTREELVAVEKAFRRRANVRWLAAGVTLVDPEVTYIDQTVTIGMDTIIWPNTYLQGSTVIGERCILGPNVVIRDSRIGDGCLVEQSVVENATLASGLAVEPFSTIRNKQLGNRAKALR